MIPGWPYSVVAALQTGHTSWTAVLDAVRLQPGADLTAVTAAQLRLARPLAVDLRRPWEKQTEPNKAKEWDVHEFP